MIEIVLEIENGGKLSIILHSLHTHVHPEIKFLIANQLKHKPHTVPA